MRVTAPVELREEPRGLSLARLSLRASRFRVPTVVNTPLAATRPALRSLAQRFRQLSAEIARLDVQLARLVAEAAPQLVARPGIGQIAGQLLVTAGDNPTRLRSEGAFAMLVGTAPIPASSGKTDRQRLNRAGDRQANPALYMLALSRLSRDPDTQAYVWRRTAECKSKPEIIRCMSATRGAGGAVRRSGDRFDPAHAPEMDAGAFPDHDRHDRHVAAGWAAHDVASAPVDPHRAKGVHRPARGAAAARVGHLASEDLDQQAAERIAVHVNRIGHVVHPPVGPKRSVSTRAGSWPSSTSADATASTRPVGPQT
jgi:hypothetical protein